MIVATKSKTARILLLIAVSRLLGDSSLKMVLKTSSAVSRADALNADTQVRNPCLNVCINVECVS